MHAWLPLTLLCIIHGLVAEWGFMYMNGNRICTWNIISYTTRGSGIWHGYMSYSTQRWAIPTPELESCLEPTPFSGNLESESEPESSVFFMNGGINFLATGVGVGVGVKMLVWSRSQSRDWPESPIFDSTTPEWYKPCHIWRGKASSDMRRCGNLYVREDAISQIASWKNIWKLNFNCTLGTVQ